MIYSKKKKKPSLFSSMNKVHENEPEVCHLYIFIIESFDKRIVITYSTIVIKTPYDKYEH